MTWKDRKAFVTDLRAIYQAPTRETAEMRLLELDAKWGKTYPTVVRSWESNWEDLATMFDYPSDIRRLIYTTNTVEGYNRQLRKVTKTKGSFPSAEAARKLRVSWSRVISRGSGRCRRRIGRVSATSSRYASRGVSQPIKTNRVPFTHSI